MNNLATAPILETDRLLLRPHRIEDFERFADAYTTARSGFIGGPLSRDQSWRTFLCGIGTWSLIGFGSWAIEHRESGSYIGQIALNFPPEFPEREIGWILWEEFEGKGFALEAAIRARKFAYQQLHWTTIVSYISPKNDRSVQLAERMGARVDKSAATPNGESCLVFRHPAPDSSE